MTPVLWSLLVCPAWTESQPEAASPLTLGDCYRLALKRSEAIAIHEELITQAEARFTRAMSGILPRVSFSSSDKRQDGSGGSAFTLKEVPERKFVMSQPLFSGFKEFAAMKGAQAQKRQRAYERNRAEQLLFVDVSDAFYLLLEKERELESLAKIHETLRDRLTELRQRQRIGRSRASEVASAQTLLYQTEAEIELLQSQATAARLLLEFLTGREPLGEIQEEPLFLPSVEPKENLLTQSGERPDVKAFEEALTVADQAIRATKADRWPTVSLEGNYWVERVGASKDVNWDAALKVDVPIFDGGETSGAVQEATSQAAQAKWRAQETRRRAAQEIQDAYEKFQVSLARNAALGRAERAAQEAAQLQADEHRLSLISTIDFLQSLEKLEETQRQLTTTQYEAKRAYWALRAAAGETV